MTTRLEQIDGGNWKDFLQAPVAVLMLGKSDCAACQGWTQELEQFLAGDTEWTDVRFGKMILDKGGLGSFKRANPWLADVDVLPYTLIYQAGKKVAEFPGGGIDRLQARLQRLKAEAAGVPPTA